VDDSTPRQLNERTGKHYCIVCLREVATEEYFRNDQICDACAEKDEYPLASTPEERVKGEKR
jgi:CRISPR/Cas system-associated protein Cas10 (large subunit of type III CRISPR-Cas system)